MASFKTPSYASDLPRRDLGVNTWDVERTNLVLSRVDLGKPLGLYIDDQVGGVSLYLNQIVRALTAVGDMNPTNIIGITPNNISAHEAFIGTTGASAMYLRNIPYFLAKYGAAAAIRTLDHILEQTTTGGLAPETAAQIYDYFLRNIPSVMQAALPSEYNLQEGQTVVDYQRAAYMGTLFDVFKSSDPAVSALLSSDELVARIASEAPSQLGAFDYDLSQMDGSIVDLLVTLSSLSITDPRVAIVTQYPNNVDLSLAYQLGVKPDTIKGVVGKSYSATGELVELYNR